MAEAAEWRRPYGHACAGQRQPDCTQEREQKGGRKEENMCDHCSHSVRVTTLTVYISHRFPRDFTQAFKRHFVSPVSGFLVKRNQRNWGFGCVFHTNRSRPPRPRWGSICAAQSWRVLAGSCWRALQNWAANRGISIEYTQPGKPQQNSYVERFNRTVRYEWLAQCLLASSSHYNRHRISQSVTPCELISLFH